MASGFFFETTRSTWETMSSCEVVSFRGRGVGRLKEVMGHDVKSLHSEVAEGRKGTGMLVEVAGHMDTGARHLKCWEVLDIAGWGSCQECLSSDKQDFLRFVEVSLVENMCAF